MDMKPTTTCSRISNMINTKVIGRFAEVYHSIKTGSVKNLGGTISYNKSTEDLDNIQISIDDVCFFFDRPDHDGDVQIYYYDRKAKKYTAIDAEVSTIEFDTIKKELT